MAPKIAPDCKKTQPGLRFDPALAQTRNRCFAPLNNVASNSFLVVPSPDVLTQEWEERPGDEVHSVGALGQRRVGKDALLQHGLSQTLVHVRLQVHEQACKDVQSGASYLSQGFEDNVLGSSSSWLADTVATYRPGRSWQLTQKNITKH